MIESSESLSISNAWRKGLGGTFTSQDPATGAIIWKGQEATSEDVNEAVLSSKNAFKTWSLLSLEERFSFLNRFTSLLSASKKNFAATISKETGKPLWDSLSEVEAMANKAMISLEAYKSRCGVILNQQTGCLSVTRHRPHGVVAVLGPYNFPGHLPNGHIMPALLAGNTVVFKPSELTPLTAIETLRLWREAGLPSGVLNLVQGGRLTGQSLISHESVQGVFFTGSLETGQFLAQSFASQPWKILALEMGGNNPLIVGETSDVVAAAHLIVQSAYLTSGQRCTCARRLILPHSDFSEKLIGTLIELVESLIIGPYTDIPEPFMGPVISEMHARKMIDSEEKLVLQGAKSLIKMRTIEPGTGFITPGLIDSTKLKKRQDVEIFGPLLQIIRVDHFQEAIEEANRTKFGLSAGLISNNRVEYNHFLGAIQAGITSWNRPMTGASSTAPFGGIKCSGNHRPSAYYAADYCAYPVASLEIPELKLPSSFLPGIRTCSKSFK